MNISDLRNFNNFASSIAYGFNRTVNGKDAPEQQDAKETNKENGKEQTQTPMVAGKNTIEIRTDLDDERKLKNIYTKKGLKQNPYSDKKGQFMDLYL